MADNITYLSDVKREWRLDFTCPKAFHLGQNDRNDIRHLEIGSGEGFAYVLASTKSEAKQKLHRYIPVKEWIGTSND